MTINWKALVADRAAGTPGSWTATPEQHVADMRRVQRLPDLEAYVLETCAKLEAAEAIADHYKAMRKTTAEIAEYILNRTGPGLSDYEARGIFADLQRARFRSDHVIAAWDAAQKGHSDDD